MGGAEPEQKRSPLVFALLVVGGYFVAGRIGHAFAPADSPASLVWPGAGIAVATLYRRGWAYAPAVGLGSFLLSVSLGAPFGFAVLASIAAFVGPGIAVALLRRSAFDPTFSRQRDALHLGWTVAVAMTVSGAIGAFAAVTFGSAPRAAYGSIWLVWWLGDALGALVVTPLILASSRGMLQGMTRARTRELALLIVASIVAGGLVLLTGQRPLTFIVMLPIVWSTLRFPGAIASWIVAVTATFAAVGVSGMSGAFGGAQAQESLLLLTGYMVTAAGVSLILGAIMAERRAIELALSASEERRLRALRAGTAGTWELDVATEKITWDEGHAALWGIPLAQFDGRFETLLAGIHPEDAVNAAATFTLARTTGEPLDIEFRVVFDDGERWINLRGEAIRGEGDKIVRLIGVALDITGRKTTENDLALRRRLLAAIHRVSMDRVEDERDDPRRDRAYFERLLVMVLELTQSEYGYIGEAMTDDDGARHLAILAVSELVWIEPTLARFAKVDVDGELRDLDTLVGDALQTGKTVIANEAANDPRSRCLPEHAPPIAEFLALPVLRQTEVIGVVAIANRRGGYDETLASQLEPILSTCGSLIVSGRAERKSRAAEDEARAKQHAAEQERSVLEAEIRQAQKMEAIGTLAGGVAHDFNNILGAILPNLDLAIGDLPTDHPVQEMLADVRQASLRGRDVVKQMLAFGRRAPSNAVVVSVGRIVQEAHRLLRASLPASIRLEIMEEDCPTVLADPSHLHQVVVNLVTNAAHAMPKGGTIRVRVGPVAPANGIEPQVVLAVTDDGEGMDAETLRRVFEPFFTTKPVGKGTGLGLSVVHGIVKELRGDVDIESAPGKGTTVSVRLPAHDGEQPVVTPPAPSSSVVRSAHVMLVDDELPLLRVFRRALEKRGYGVTTFANAAEAVARFAAEPAKYDVIVTDLTMEAMDGLALADAVLAKRADVPIILTTGSADAGAPEILAGRVRELLHKPMSADDLANAIARHLRAARIEPASTVAAPTSGRGSTAE